MRETSRSTRLGRMAALCSLVLLWGCEAQLQALPGSEEDDSLYMEAALLSGGSLRVSTVPERTDSIGLEGSVVSQSAFVFLDRQNQRVSRVSYYLDDPTRLSAPFAVRRAAPYDLMGVSSTGLALPLDTTALVEGAHTLTARVVFRNRTAQTLTASFRVANTAVPLPLDTQPPELLFASPADGATVSGNLVVSGTAADDVGLATLELRVDSGGWALAAEASSWTFTLDTAALASGSHTLTVRATDLAGNSALATRTVMVAPTAGLVMPDATNTGPRYALTGTLKMSQVVPGNTYQRMRVVNDLPQYGNMIGAGQPATTFIDCEIDTAIVYSPVHLEHSRIYGFFPYNSGGSAKFTHFRGDGFQGFRPSSDPYGQMTSIPYVVEDSFIENTSGAGAGTGAHTEAMQSLAAANLVFRRTRFHQGGEFDGTITAVINHWGDNLLAEDVWITADKACAYYMLYSNGRNSRWVRPRFSNVGMAVLYPESNQMPTLVDPMWLDGTPIP